MALNIPGSLSVPDERLRERRCDLRTRHLQESDFTDGGTLKFVATEVLLYGDGCRQATTYRHFSTAWMLSKNLCTSVATNSRPCTSYRYAIGVPPLASYRERFAEYILQFTSDVQRISTKQPI